MQKSLFVLGRQPALGVAELESLLGAEHVAPFGGFVLSDIAPQDVPFERLGGSVKLCEVIGAQDSADWRKLEKTLLQVVPERATALGEGKLHFGLSVYGVRVGVKDVSATALRLKKAIRAKTNQTVRVAPNNELALSTAQVLHSKLVSDQGMEIVLVQRGSEVYVAQTVREQDIEAYTKRDQSRPKRDARVGMLPPKLAQIITNLATGKSKDSLTVLDPFCGTGVVLQEAALMGYNVYGTDVEPRMIEYSAANLQWLDETHKLSEVDVTLQVGDATAYQWPDAFNAVACEGYLGQPFSAPPSEAKLREVAHTCNQIAKGFLKNIAEQIPSGTLLAIALPAWQRANGTFEHLKLLDQIEELGYNRVVLKHVRPEELLYYRPDQVVVRELLILTKQ